MQLAVLNAGGRDAEQHFPDGAGVPDDRVHAPVNYHAYAACTRGGFFRDVDRVPDSADAVLVLLRSNLKPALAAVRALRQRGKAVAISWKESGQHQVAQQLDDADTLARFREVCALAGRALSSTSELVALYRDAGATEVEFIPTPYPIGDPRWDFSVPLESRRGIFIGTREWDVPARNHASALLHSGGLGVPVTAFNEDGRAGQKKLAAIGCGQLRVIEGRLPYTEYLREMAKCRVVFQCDASAVPGQVAGDALLCGMPCIGGNSAVEQVAFGDLPGLDQLLRDDAAWHGSVAASQARAAKSLGHASVAARLEAFFGGSRQ